jgi:hypothetical protein
MHDAAGPTIRTTMGDDDDDGGDDGGAKGKLEHNDAMLSSPLSLSLSSQAKSRAAHAKQTSTHPPARRFGSSVSVVRGNVSVSCSSAQYLLLIGQDSSPRAGRPHSLVDPNELGRNKRCRPRIKHALTLALLLTHDQNTTLQLK